MTTENLLERIEALEALESRVAALEQRLSVDTTTLERPVVARQITAHLLAEAARAALASRTQSAGDSYISRRTLLDLEQALRRFDESVQQPTPETMEDKVL